MGRTAGDKSSWGKDAGTGTHQSASYLSPTLAEVRLEFVGHYRDVCENRPAVLCG